VAAGSVTFRDGATTLGTATLDGSGVASLPVLLGVGSHSITAAYAGNANFLSSTSAAIAQVVNKGASTVALVSNANPAAPGDSVTFTATVTAAAGTPTGPVLFMDGDAALGSGSLSGGITTYSSAGLSLGAHVITAVYGGDASFAGSTSPPVIEQIRRTCNDFFASAGAILGAHGSAFGNNTGTTGEAGEPDHAGNSQPLSSVWCKWTSPGSGTATFDTTGSNFDTTLAVYTGGSLSSLTPVVANDNISSSNSQSRVSFAAAQGLNYFVALDGAGPATGNYYLNWALADPSANIFASILPSARSVTTRTTATAFATMINAGATTATACAPAAPAGIPAVFSYQITDAANLPTGTANTPKDIAAGAAQSFVFAVTPLQDFNGIELGVVFGCANAPLVATVPGLNTLLLSASAAPSPDMISIGSTPTNDGILNIPGNTGSAAFGAAAIDIGAAGTLVASIDDNGKGLALTPSLCQSNPQNGACVNPPSPAVSATLQVNTNDVITFSIFVTGTGVVPFDPGNNRLFLRLKTADGVTRGATSVAVRTR
jgi:hypothetical protein